ncbi:MAG: RidA family protein [Gammaproteobacteria bacterium]|nr:RidA family protein [Gammaproteobacteria bacterium]
MSKTEISTGTAFETLGNYCRAKRVGPFVFVAGTTAIDEHGAVYASGNTYNQSIYVFKRIRSMLQEMGAGVEHVVRTRAYLTDIARGAEEYLRAHGEVFRDVRPVATGVEAKLIMPGMMVEIEVDALVCDSQGNPAY